MTMRIYQSTDASAPSLEGVVGGAYSSGWAAGSLLELLRQVLVAGYGTQTAAGWTLSYTGTSEGTFRQGAGCQFYLNVLDDASLTAGAREASFWGSETASAVITGTGLFPTAAQQSTGLKFRKSDTADSTTRQWLCFADNKTFYLFSWTGQTTAYLAGMAFGNFHSFVANDAYNCMAIGRITTATSDTLTNETLDLVTTGSSTGTVLPGHYFARGYNQLGTSVQFSVAPATLTTTGSSTTPMGAQAQVIPFPNNADSTLVVSRNYLLDPTTTPTGGMRGYLRGLWSPWQNGANIPFNYTFSGIGTLSGKTFNILGLRTGNNSAGRYTMETSDTWDS